VPAIIGNFVSLFNNNKKTKSSSFLRSQTAGGENQSMLSISTLANIFTSFFKFPKHFINIILSFFILAILFQKSRI